MTHKRFKKFWNLIRLWLVVRELKRVSAEKAKRVPRGPFAFAVFLLCACSASLPANKDPIVVVMRDGLPNCSGFAIERNTILTAAHCVDDRNEVEVVTEAQWSRTANAFTPAVVEFRDPGRDLATLTGEFNFPAHLNFRSLLTGEPIYARSVFFGAITDGNVLEGDGFFRDTTMTVEPGWSGSPVFAFDGKVVGLVHSCEAETRGQHRVCIPHSTQIAVLP